jgi:xylose dehydrogenase (NAD/NADP)
MSKIRWGLLSTANINRRLISAIRASKLGVVAAVASRDEETANNYATQWQIPHPFGSYEAMIESDTIDSVYISLPNHLHAKWSIRAMQAGKHVLCEKPLALSTTEAEQMIAASKECGKVLAEAIMYRHHSQTKIAGEWAHEGKLGDIVFVRGVFNYALKNHHNIRLVPAYGGGSLWDVGVYPVSFAQFIMRGLPKQVSGCQCIGESIVDESFAGLMCYAGDRIAQIAASFRSPFYTYCEIIGTEGRLTLNRPFVSLDEHRKMIFHPKEGEPTEITIPEKELYLGEVEDMHTAILEDVPNYVTLEESLNHIRTVEALYQSAREREMVNLE